jgi:hypothetical protein
MPSSTKRISEPSRNRSPTGSAASSRLPCNISEASMSSVLGRTVEGNSSLFGVGLFMLWLVLVAVCRWEVAGRAALESDESEPE